MNRIRSRCLIVLIALLALNATAHAQNMVSNAGFAVDTIGWMTLNAPSEIQVGWSNLDANGQMGSGSAQVNNTSPGASNGVTIEQCLPSVAGESYRFGGAVMIPSGGTQTLTNAARVGLRFMSDLNCMAAIGGAIAGGSPGAFDTWTNFAPILAMAPVGTNSMQIRLLVTKFPAGGSFYAHFDNVFVFPADYIFGDSFES